MNDYRLDSHKLIYHPKTVARWLNGDQIYPIEIEISPSGACNHRCIFCAYDYVGYQPIFLNKEIIMRDIRQMKKMGLKSVVCSGEGEPLLNKDYPEIVSEIKSLDIDVAMSSNGALFKKEFADDYLEKFTWVRFSVSSFEDESYYEIQRAPEGDLEKVKENIAYAVEVKKKKKMKTTIGVQCLLLPKSKEQLLMMARELRKIGVDYFTIKPYSKNLHSKNDIRMDYSNLEDVKSQLNELITPDFSIYFRANAINSLHRKKEYKSCLGLPFMTHIDADGNVWPCVSHIGVEEYKYGNIYEKSFQEIWEGENRKKVIEKLWSSDINEVCKEACRLDAINVYLNDLVNPGEHVNFI